MLTITHEQNIICRKTNLHHKMHHPTNIFRQLHVFTGHASEKEDKTSLMITEIQSLNWLLMCRVGLNYSH